eukprot:6940363-Pyramimonas_sp.AAC.1
MFGHVRGDPTDCVPTTSNCIPCLKSSPQVCQDHHYFTVGAVPLAAAVATDIDENGNALVD